MISITLTRYFHKLESLEPFIIQHLQPPSTGTDITSYHKCSQGGVADDRLPTTDIFRRLRLCYIPFLRWTPTTLIARTCPSVITGRRNDTLTATKQKKIVKADNEKFVHIDNKLDSS